MKYLGLNIKARPGTIIDGKDLSGEIFYVINESILAVSCVKSKDDKIYTHCIMKEDCEII